MFFIILILIINFAHAVTGLNLPFYQAAAPTDAATGAASDAPDAAYALDAFNEQNYEKCIAIGQAAIKLSPLDPDPHFVMGRCYERMLNFEAAWQEYNKVIKMDPTYPDVHHNRVLLSLKLMNANRAKNEVLVWRKYSPRDHRIKEFSVMIEQMLEIIREGKLDVKIAKEVIKFGYKKSLKEKTKTVNLTEIKK